MHFSEYDTRLAAYALLFDQVDGVDRVLLTWWNGEGRWTPGWSLPGGGVEFDETVEEAVVREVREESGYDVEVGAPLLVHSFTRPGEDGRPYKSLRVVFAGTVVGGTLGTLEIGGTTDFAQWLPVTEVTAQPSRADIVDLGLAARR